MADDNLPASPDLLPPANAVTAAAPPAPPQAVTTAPAPAPDGEDAPPVDIARGLLRSALHAVLGAVAGLALGIVVYFVATLLFHWNTSVSTLVLMLGGGLVLGVAFSGSLVRMVGLTPRGRSRSLVVGGDDGRSEIQLLAGWLVGLILVLVSGWGLIALSYYVAGALFHHGERVAASLAVLLSLGLFLLLEQRHWLSRLMGLRVTPDSPAWKSALFLTLFGVPGLLVRSTLAARAAQPPDAGKSAAKGRDDAPAADGIREVVETVVFVVVLVLMLKSFAAEAFVIPTGSMAETLLGYQKMVTCPECGFEFPVNCSQQVDPQSGRPPEWVGAGVCPNCRERVRFIPFAEDHLFGLIPLGRTYLEPDGRAPRLDAKGQNVGPRAPDEVADPEALTGDRVLVAKFLYDLFEKPPNRLDVVVFKYPGDGDMKMRDRFPLSGPFRDGVPMNYIKRLIGLPGETIAIHNGNLYVLHYPDYVQDAPDSNRIADLRKKLHDELNRDATPDELHDALLQNKKISYFDLERVPEAERPELAKRLWEKDHMRVNERDALELFQSGAFEIVRKGPDAILSMRRIVYDNDHPAKDLAGLQPPRWSARDKDAAWDSDGGHGFKRAAAGDDQVHWIGYQHLLRDQKLEDKVREEAMEKFRKSIEAKLGEKLRRTPSADELRDALARDWYEDNLPADLRQAEQDARSHDYAGSKPQLITDFMGYNTAGGRGPGEDWVGDLSLDCEVEVAQAQGEVTLELSKGVDRFQARFDVGSGECKLVRLHDGIEEELDRRPTAFKGGTHALRFADVDERLTVWVDDALPFGDGVTYQPPKNAAPTKENDLDRPAGVGVKGTAATVRGLKLYRDTYYTTQHDGSPSDADAGFVNFSDPSGWARLADLPTTTLYVQPDPRHYLCLGDNSPESSDGRSWGLVPERLLLGKAVAVYYPFNRFGRIR